MKKMFTLVLAIALAICFTPTFGKNTFWTQLDGKTAPSKLPMTVKPGNYTLFTLQTNEMKTALSKAGKTYEDGVTIYLPGPNNTLSPFVAWETPMMQHGLAAQFPEIKTYSAQSLENLGISAKLDFTDYGFRAAIYQGNSIYLIDPYSRQENGYYVGYYEKDLPGMNEKFKCTINQYPNLLQPAGTPVQVISGHDNVTQQQNGSIRRNYLLALACTGEYAQNVTAGNPSPSAVLSVIVSTVNRINGVYERELSVTFTLIDEEADILFLDPMTDPYACNLNLDCLLNENQAAINTAISGHYDIGHIFCTAGGGLAQLYAVCAGNGKARAASTTSGPSDFHVPLHEMGHQFSARHTFNAESGGCAGNIDTSSSYEPGSGSSIMSYGGACPPNNLGAPGGNYFHVANLIQMHTFLVSQGSTTGCGTTTVGINSVTIPDGLIKTYNIPKSTPFMLNAPPFQPSQANATIAYNWEQYDLGNFGGTEADDGDATAGPIMRSYPPSDSSNNRYFPIDLILNGSYSGVGERLPTKPRDVHFKLSARSLMNGWGSFAYMDSVVTLSVSNQGPFRVTAPASDLTLNPGETVSVTWSNGQTDAAPVSCSNVNIYLSIDGGQSFPILLVGSAPNTGSYDAPIPNISTTKGLIKVQGVSNIFYDIGKGKLTINGTNTGIANSNLHKHIKVFPNPATNVVHLQHTAKAKTTLIVNMYNMTGRLVWSGKLKNQLDIPVAGFARGNYQIQLINSQSAAYTSYSISLK